MRLAEAVGALALAADVSNGLAVERSLRTVLVASRLARLIDARLVVGASIFGIGWGLGGVCPGPGFTSLGAGAAWALPYIGALTVGMLVVDLGRLGRAARGPA